MNQPGLSPNMTRSVELLAPAGDIDCVRAAIENGADAVYFGLQGGFNARDRAKNFPIDDLAELMQLLHLRGLRGYVALNTLAFPEELPEAEAILRAITEAGVDAALIQDLGVLQLAREVSPDLEIHASTQMTLSSAECIREAEKLGVDRVVLARELSIDEIRKVSRQTDMPLEVFVHGALCVAYSGQCLTSESLGGRSANRGQCAQACRLPYELICDGEDVDLGSQQKYLLSPQDLAAHDLIPQLLAAGVTSFKIEGRLKTPEYVANITHHYRRVLDAAVADAPLQLSRQDREEMELSFSRGFSPGWLKGNDHKMLVPGLSSAKRGVLLGEVTRIERGRVQVRLRRSVKPGDGVVFEGDRSVNQEQGGRVYEIFQRDRRITTAVDRGVVELAFGRNDLELNLLQAGQKIWKTDDPALTKRLRQSYRGADPRRRTPVHFKVVASVGQRLIIEAEAANGSRCEIRSDDPLEAAAKHPLSIAVLEKQLSRLGGTAFELKSLEAQIDGEPMVPLSVLGQMRRQIVEQLDAVSTKLAPRHLAPPDVLARLRRENDQQVVHSVDTRLDVSDTNPKLGVLCRTLEQVETVVANGIVDIAADFQDIREYGQAVQIVHAAEAQIRLAPPRIQKPGEAGIFRALERHGADGMLVRNLAGLAYYRKRDVSIRADYTLNAANDLTVYQLRRLGAERITTSFDLNREQLLDLVRVVPTEWLEVVVHQHMPLFHMEHCVFCAVLSPGTNKTNCGRPCDDHAVHLRDRVGMEHPLTADVGCRNTLFNATPQSAAEVVPGLISAGVQQFRIDLLDESPSETMKILRLYRDLLSGSITGSEVWQQLRAANRVGVTRGTMEQRRDPLAIL